MKRTFDLLIASLIFMYSLPLFMFTSVLIRIFIGKGVLFKQVRPGKNGYPFKLYKFRTMTNAKSADGELLPDHLRMTKLGSIIRSSSIDELP
ncbi:MAG: sugar transferase, partial [Staphylococcus hyicus]